jgi:hypothetical protein
MYPSRARCSITEKLPAVASPGNTTRHRTSRWLSAGTLVGSTWIAPPAAVRSVTRQASRGSLPANHHQFEGLRPYHHRQLRRASLSRSRPPPWPSVCICTLTSVGSNGGRPRWRRPHRGAAERFGNGDAPHHAPMTPPGPEPAIGLTDFAVWRPFEGNWHIKDNASGTRSTVGSGRRHNSCELGCERHNIGELTREPDRPSLAA